MSGGSGAGGGSATMPAHTVTLVSASTASSGSAATSTQRSQRPTGSCLRLARANASIDATRAGRISVKPSSASAQPGRTLRATVT